MINYHSDDNDNDSSDTSRLIIEQCKQTHLKIVTAYKLQWTAAIVHSNVDIACDTGNTVLNLANCYVS